MSTSCMNWDPEGKFRAVTFDAAGTLLHLREPVGESYARVAREFGAAVRGDELEAAFRGAWKETPEPYSPGSDVTESQRDWWKKLVRKVFARSSAGEGFAASEDFDPFFERLFAYFAEPGVWRLDPDAPGLLEHLRSRQFSLAVISNFDDRLEAILRDLGITNFFQGIVISEDLLISKPDRRIFDHALAMLGCPARHALHVGDDPLCDGEGAAAAGMGFFLVGKGKGSLKDLARLSSLRREEKCG